MIVTIGDNGDYVEALLFSYYTAIIRWGVHRRYVTSAAREGRSYC